MNLLSQISQNNELVFKNIEQQTFENIDVQKLTIKNSIIKRCDFINVNLGHCDLLSSKLYKVQFKNVSLKCADIYSLWFSDCKFENVDFSDAGIEDITFIHCQFRDCIFEDTGLKNCTFSNSHFYNIKPGSAGIILNQYNDCLFEQCAFRGTFLYQIFDKCKFIKVKMDYSLLKYNFGIGKSEIEYYRDGNPIEGLTQLHDLLLNECAEQNIFLNAVFVDFNLSSTINPKLIIKSIEAIELMLSKEILIRTDEILFLKKLYQFMYESKIIAPIILYELLNKIREMNKFKSLNIAYAKSREALSLIYNDLYFDFFTFCDELQLKLENLPQLDMPLQLFIDYEHEPNIPLTALLNKCLPDTFVRIKAEQGSFHEIIDMLPQGIDVLNIFLQILGISIPIIYTEVKAKSKKEKPQNKIDKTVNFNIINQSNSKNSNKIVQQTCKALAASSIINENFNGYNNSNIKEIKIQYNINIQV